MDKDQNVTGRSTARHNKREARNNREEEANLGQVLRVTPDRDRRETLATAIVLQRARAAAQRKDSEAAFAAEQKKRARELYHVSAQHDATSLKFRSKPPVMWTPGKSGVEYDTDADEENSEDEEEEYDQDEKTNEDEPMRHDDQDAAAIAAAEDADNSVIATPAQDRALTPTQSDQEFIATDDENGIFEDNDDADYYPSTADDNDEEEEELLIDLLQSGSLSEQQSTRVRTRLRSMQRSRAIARTLFNANKDINEPEPKEQVPSISPPLKDATATRSAVAAENTRPSPTPTVRTSYIVSTCHVLKLCRDLVK